MGNRPSAKFCFDFENADAMRGFAFADIVRVLRPLRPAVGVYIGAIYELVIDYEDVFPLTSEEQHTVDIIAEGAFLAGASSTANGIERCRVGPQRITPAGHDMPIVTHWNRDRIEAVRHYGGKSETIRWSGTCKLCSQRARDQCKGTDADTALEN